MQTPPVTMRFRVRLLPNELADPWLRRLVAGGARVGKWEMRGVVLVVFVRVHDRERLRAALGGRAGARYSLQRVNDH